MQNGEMFLFVPTGSKNTGLPYAWRTSKNFHFLILPTGILARFTGLEHIGNYKPKSSVRYLLNFYAQRSGKSPAVRRPDTGAGVKLRSFGKILPIKSIVQIQP